MSEERTPFRIRDHIGMISGIFLGLVALAFVIVLAALGVEGAVTLLVVVAVGIGLIALGTRLRS